MAAATAFRNERARAVCAESAILLIYLLIINEGANMLKLQDRGTNLLALSLFTNRRAGRDAIAS